MGKVSPLLTVRDMMVANPRWLAPETPVAEALHVLLEGHIGTVLVVQDGKLIGLCTKSDFLRKMKQLPSGWEVTPIRDWMSPYPYTSSPQASWEEAVHSLERLNVEHLPVVENGQLIGLVTTRTIIEKRTQHLNQQIQARTREVRQANDALISRDAELNHYMQAAARLQHRLVLPSESIPPNQLPSAVRYIPLDPLGGDYYDYCLDHPNYVGVLIADASGHSIPAAMVAILTHWAFEKYARTSIVPGEVLATMNRQLLNLSDDRFVTAFYGIFHLPSRTLHYANAGHPFPLVLKRGNKEVQHLSARGFMLGILPDEVYTGHETQLEPLDRVLFFTDGAPDARDERGETLGMDRLSEFFASTAHLNVNDAMTAIHEKIDQFRGTTAYTDDVTLVLVELPQA
ncbi:MAG: SpoIIE family protein phosphatase [Zavarzinella sp.]